MFFLVFGCQTSSKQGDIATGPILSSNEDVRTASGILIALSIEEQAEDLYLGFTAGPYWKQDNFDYGPDEIVKAYVEVVNDAGEIKWQSADSPTRTVFRGDGRLRYAKAKIFSAPPSIDGWKLTGGVAVVGIEGNMSPGPKEPMWTGRSSKQSWVWPGKTPPPALLKTK